MIIRKSFYFQNIYFILLPKSLISLIFIDCYWVLWEKLHIHQPVLFSSPSRHLEVTLPHAFEVRWGNVTSFGKGCMGGMSCNTSWQNIWKTKNNSPFLLPPSQQIPVIRCEKDRMVGTLSVRIPEWLHGAEHFSTPVSITNLCCIFSRPEN